MTTVVFFTSDASIGKQVVGQVGGGVAVGLGDVRALEHLAQGGEDDFHVAQEGDVPDVFQVVGYLGFPGHGVPAVHLREPAESLAYCMALALFGGHKDHVAHELRPRPDYGHVALEDVEEFGQFVEAGTAKEFPVRIQADIVREKIALGILLVRHRTELDELEDLFALAGAGLRKEGITLHLDCTHNRENNEQRAQAEDCRESTEKVQDSF